MLARFQGALLGTMLGDAMGRLLEGASLDAVAELVGSISRSSAEYAHRRAAEMELARSLLVTGHGRYSDDTQLTIALAEALLQTPGRVDLDAVAERFATNFDPDRAYGASTAAILEAVQLGLPWRQAVACHGFPGGSFGNGAAMRVVPVALAFYANQAAVAAAAERQAEVTGHHHPLGRFGARIQAFAILRAIRTGREGLPFDGESLLGDLTRAAPEEYKAPLQWIGSHLHADPGDAGAALGSDGSALRSVPTALWCFLSHLDDPTGAILSALTIGGDVDTVCSMTASLVGGRHGVEVFSAEWIELLDNGEAGRDYVLWLAGQLWELAAKP